MARPGLRTVLEVIATSAYLILMFALVPSYSYIGAAFAFLGYGAIRSGLAYKFFKDALRDKSRK
jgi:O-antigen/teichoic acid export membrane protein